MWSYIQPNQPSSHYASEGYLGQWKSNIAHNWQDCEVVCLGTQWRASVLYPMFLQISAARVSSIPCRHFWCGWRDPVPIRKSTWPTVEFFNRNSVYSVGISLAPGQPAAVMWSLHMCIKDSAKLTIDYALGITRLQLYNHHQAIIRKPVFWPLFTFITAYHVVIKALCHYL